MAYVKYATSDTIYSLNDDNWKIEILRNDVGTATDYKFEVGPAGVQLIYESEQDDILIPGIVHSRCEVETIWPTDVASELDDMVESMIDSEDGVWFMQVYKNGDKDWFGPILIDEVQLQETSAARACRIVASDGISLLKTIDYNDNGSEYSTNQNIFDDVLQNIQEKWVSYTYADETFSGPERRLAVADYMYSEDIYTVTTTPPAYNSRLTKKMELAPHMFSYTNDDGEVNFINCYDLLDSICKTLLLRLYYYEQAWYFMPCYSTEEPVRCYELLWSGVEVSGNTAIDGFNFQVDTLNNEKQKGNEWTYTFTPAINEVTITRDTNNGSIVLGEGQITGGSAVSANTIQFTTGDSGYILYGNILVERSALSPTVGLLNDDRLGRYVLAFRIRFGNSSGNYQYYNNTISAQPQGLFSWSMPSISVDGNSLVFTPLNITEGEYSSTSGYYYWHDTDYQNCIFDGNEDNAAQIFWSLQLPAVPTDLTAVSIETQVFTYDRDGNFSQDLQNTIDTQTYTVYFTYGNEEVQPAPNYDVVANSTFGRGSIDLGKTYIGELHQNVGGIMVETSAGVFQTSTNWSTQSYDYDAECNQVGVREVLAAHYKPRAVERGNIVMRGNGVAPPPFWLFIDDDTTDVYQCINYRLATTPAEVEVTLHKVGTDGQAQTTTTSQDFEKPPRPEPLPGLGKGESFGNAFTSGFDFNDDAIDAFNQTWTSVIGSETLEGYVTYVGPGKGVYFDFQGDTAPTGYNIVRKIYTQTKGRGLPVDSGWSEIHAKYRPAVNSTLREAIDKINTHWSGVTNPDRTFLLTYTEQGTGLLDTYGNAQAAYSLRKLRADYTGNAIQVRNDSGTLLDIGFDSDGDLDTAAITTHVGSGSGTIATWYDQSGNGRDATQSTLTLQPYIALAGIVFTVNSLPAVRFASDYMTTSAFAPNPNGAVNYLAVSQWDVTNSDLIVANQFGSDTTQRNFYYRMKSDGRLQMSQYYGNSQAQIFNPSASTAANTQYIFSAEFASSISNAYFNGTLVTGTLNSGTPENDSEELRIGALGTNGTQALRGYVQEFIMWSNTTEHDADAISTDVNDYYSAF